MNKIYSISPLIDAEAALPVTLAEAKAHLHITFSDDDTLISALIDQCIDIVEKSTNTKIRLQTLSVQGDFCVESELPCGPVIGTVAAKLRNNAGTYDTITAGTDFYVDPPASDPTTTGSSYFVRFRPIATGRMWIIYKAGYGDQLPPTLKLAILNEIAFRYMKRGDDTSRIGSENIGICQSAKILSNPYRRLNWL